jgi:hypothetical protein
VAFCEFAVWLSRYPKPKWQDIFHTCNGEARAAQLRIFRLKKGGMAAMRSYLQTDTCAFGCATSRDSTQFAPEYGPAGAARNSAGQSRIDPALYLNAVCKILQSISPDCGPIEYFSGRSAVGMLPERFCRLLGLLVCELISGVADAGVRRSARPMPIRVMLLQRSTFVMCVICSPSLSETKFCASSGFECVNEMTAKLQESCTLSFMPEQGLVAVILDTEKAGLRASMAISAYRLAKHEAASDDTAGAQHA